MKKQIIFNLKASDINRILNKVDDSKFKPIVLDFDFKNLTLTIDNKKTLKVERDFEFTYKFMKTKVKAIGGIEGLYNHIEKASNPENFWNNRMYTVLVGAKN